MDIGSVEGVLAIQAVATTQQINIAVLAKTMDIAKAQGQAVVALLESAAEVSGQIQNSDGRHLDIRV